MHRDRHHSIANCPRPKSYGRTAPAMALLPARRTHRDPYVEAGGTGSIRGAALPIRGEHECAAIVRETGRHGAGYVEFSDVHRGSAGLAVARHRRVVDVRLQQRVDASVEV